MAGTSRHEIAMLRTGLIIADPVKQLCKVIGRFIAIGPFETVPDRFFFLCPRRPRIDAVSRYRL